jgi:hypothetical protein
MSMKRALQAILVVSVVGVISSGTLLYREVCHQLIEACALGGTTGEEGMILGYPPSLYGLGMYLLLVAIAVLGLRSAR